MIPLEQLLLTTPMESIDPSVILESLEVAMMFDFNLDQKPTFLFKHAMDPEMRKLLTGIFKNHYLANYLTGFANSLFDLENKMKFYSEDEKDLIYRNLSSIETRVMNLFQTGEEFIDF